MQSEWIHSASLIMQPSEMPSNLQKSLTSIEDINLLIFKKMPQVSILNPSAPLRPSPFYYNKNTTTFQQGRREAFMQTNTEWEKYYIIEYYI